MIEEKWSPTIFFINNQISTKIKFFRQNFERMVIEITKELVDVFFLVSGAVTECFPTDSDFLQSFCILFVIT